MGRLRPALDMIDLDRLCLIYLLGVMVVGGGVWLIVDPEYFVIMLLSFVASLAAMTLGAFARSAWRGDQFGSGDRIGGAIAGVIVVAACIMHPRMLWCAVLLAAAGAGGAFMNKPLEPEGGEQPAS